VLVVKGIYENGVVTPVDSPPLKGRQEVTVLVPKEDGTRDSDALCYAGMLRDLTPEERADFDEALARGIRFDRRVQA